MYFHTFGSSGLLHLLIGHPRVVGFLGIAATVASLMAPLGPGRFGGSAAYLERIDAALAPRAAAAEALDAKARRDTEVMLGVARIEEINAAVAYVLRECGDGCTDLTTPEVTDDAALLRRVLTLYHLDIAANAARTAERLTSPGVNVREQR